MKKVFGVLYTLIFVGIGVYLIFNGNKMNKECTEKTIGTVVRVEEETMIDNNQTTYYYPVVKYKANDQEITRRAAVGETRNLYYSNEEITIYYNPNNNEEFIVKGYENASFTMGVAFIIIGLAACFIVIFKNGEIRGRSDVF